MLCSSMHTRQTSDCVVFNVTVSRYSTLRLASGSGTLKAIRMSLFFPFYFCAIIIFARAEHSFSSLIKQGLYDWSQSITLKFLKGIYIIGVWLAENKGKLWIMLPWWQLTVWPDFLVFETKVQEVVSNTTKNTDISNYEWLETEEICMFCKT